MFLLETIDMVLQKQRRRIDYFPFLTEVRHT